MTNELAEDEPMPSRTVNVEHERADGHVVTYTIRRADAVQRELIAELELAARAMEDET